MAKNLMLFLATTAVVAFAVPVSASAAPAITDPAGVLVASGAKIQLTNIGAVSITTNYFGGTSCPVFRNTVALTTNTGTTVSGVGVGEGTIGCLREGNPIQGKGFVINEVHSATVGSGSLNLTFSIPFLGMLGSCHFESSNLPFAYTSGGDVIKITSGDLNASPPFQCEPGLITGQFTIETDGGGAIVLD